MRFLYGTECAVLESLVLFVKRHYKLVDLLALGVLVLRTKACDEGEVGIVVYKITNVLFGRIDERTDHGDVLAAEVGDGREGAYAALVHQIQHKCVDDVVVVMAERQLVAVRLNAGIVQYSASHSGAKRAGIALLAFVEDEIGKLGLFFDKLDAVFGAKIAKRGKVRSLKAHIDRYSHDLVVYGVKPFQINKRAEQGKRVLAARKTDGYSVSIFDHFIIVDCAARCAQYSSDSDKFHVFLTR